MQRWNGNSSVKYQPCSRLALSREQSFWGTRTYRAYPSCINASWMSGHSTFAMIWIQSTFDVNVCWPLPLLIELLLTMTQSTILSSILWASTSVLSKWTGEWSRTSGAALSKARPSFVRSLVSRHSHLSSQFQDGLGRTVKGKLSWTSLRGTLPHSFSLNRAGIQSSACPWSTFVIGRIRLIRVFVL